MALESIETFMANGWLGLAIPDWVILFAIVIAWPISSHFTLKNNPVEKLRQDPDARLSAYKYTMIQLWVLALAILATWFWLMRPLEMLGFQYQLDLPTIISWAVVAGLVLFFARQYYQVTHGDEAKAKLTKELDDVGEYTQFLMPRTDQEYRRSMLVAITAGITEEIIFRGYLIWLFSQFVHPWLAGALSVAVFVFLHRYQDRAGLIQVAVFATIATVLFLASGSLWPVIALHVLVDMINITVARHVLQSKNV
ncbi:MAG: CPBP family intramembrane metalloprotease [Hellea sp.]|nr:CPBP family intramembrane metalloprotease [Hellea sp.]